MTTDILVNIILIITFIIVGVTETERPNRTEPTRTDPNRAAHGAVVACMEPASPANPDPNRPESTRREANRTDPNRAAHGASVACMEPASPADPDPSRPASPADP